MALIHFISDKDGTLFIRSVGNIPTEEVILAVQEIGRSKKIPAEFNIVVDLRQSKQLRSYDESQRIVDSYRSTLGKFQKIVYLASSDALYGVTRMISTLAEIKGYDAHATKSEKEVCELLGIKSLPTDEQFIKEGFKL